MLFRHDNKPLKVKSVSLNAYLAIFTTIAKAGLVYPVMNCIGQLKVCRFSKSPFLYIDDIPSIVVSGLLGHWITLCTF
jgi:hypothetical protein